MPELFDYSGAIDDLDAMFRRAQREITKLNGTQDVWPFYGFSLELVHTIADFTEANDAINRYI